MVAYILCHFIGFLFIYSFFFLNHFLGNAFTKPLLPRLYTLWRISFPRSAEETKTERGCGDANTWEATLEARAGALGSMGTLVEFCPELILDELAKRLIVPIETSVYLIYFNF